MYNRQDGTLHGALEKLVRISGCRNDSYLIGESQGWYIVLETKNCSMILVTF